MAKFIERVCVNCDKKFSTEKKYIKYETEKRKRNVALFCCRDCYYAYKSKIGNVEVVCKNCNLKFLKLLKECKKAPNHFCSKSCAATYNNRHKKKGTRRSKLERFVERKIRATFPGLKLETNKKTIGSELDFYFPKFKLALEINGIFHYQPIFGHEKLASIKKNDCLKRKQCKKLGIKLLIYKDRVTFSPKTGDAAWLIIQELLVQATGLEPVSD